MIHISIAEVLKIKHILAKTYLKMCGRKDLEALAFAELSKWSEEMILAETERVRKQSFWKRIFGRR